MLIICGPRSHYTEQELNDIENYFEDGGNLLISLGEGGDAKNNTNLNNFIKKKYGVGFRDDSVVRTSYYKYFHPKECYIEETKFHPDLERTIIKPSSKKKKMMSNDDLLNGEVNDSDDTKLKIVYPYGCSLDIYAKGISTLFTSGLLGYPLKRPLLTAVGSKSGKGRMLVIGSERMFDDDYFEKEDNRKIIVSLTIKNNITFN